MEILYLHDKTLLGLVHVPNKGKTDFLFLIRNFDLEKLPLIFPCACMELGEVGKKLNKE